MNAATGTPPRARGQRLLIKNSGLSNRVWDGLFQLWVTEGDLKPSDNQLGVAQLYVPVKSCDCVREVKQRLDTFGIALAV